MTADLEDRIRAALAGEARAYRAHSAMWEGVLAAIERPWWRRTRARTVIFAVGVAAAVVASVLLLPSRTGTGLQVGPASDVDAKPEPTPPPPPGPLPGWAYPFLGIASGSGDLYLVQKGGTTLLARQDADDTFLTPLGLSGSRAVYMRLTVGDQLSEVLVLAPLKGGHEQTVNVKGATLSLDRKRIAYVTVVGDTPRELVVRDVAGGHEQRLPLTGTRFARPTLWFFPHLAGHMVELELAGTDQAAEAWALDLRTARSVGDAVKQTDVTSDLPTNADKLVLVYHQNKPYLADPATGRTVRALPDNPPDTVTFADGRRRDVRPVADTGFELFDGATWFDVRGYVRPAW
jgi:hypothetical protein